MSVRKRTWTTSKGEPKEAWIVTYTDAVAKPGGPRLAIGQRRFHRTDSGHEAPYLP